MAEDSQERTERATPRRQQQAREEGQTVRSRELTTMAMLCAGAGGLIVLGESLTTRLGAMMRRAFKPTAEEITNPAVAMQALGDALLSVTLGLAPFLGLMVVAALLSTIAVGGLSFSPKALGLKWERLDPVQGMARLFNVNGLMEVAKSLIKFTLVAAVAVWWLRSHAAEFLNLGEEPLETALPHAAHLLGWSFLMISLGTILIAAVDVPFQLWHHQKGLRMSKQELKDEVKETEGKPEVKNRIRRMQREMAQRRMMQEVPKADVIVTNPTHYAVALKYDAGRMGAPRVVAKGADVIAAAIRRVAEAHRVPFFEAPPLARAIYFSTEIDEEIPKGLYVAVAQVLAYIFQLRDPAVDGRMPVPPRNLPIPEEFRRNP